MDSQEPLPRDQDSAIHSQEPCHPDPRTAPIPLDEACPGTDYAPTGSTQHRGIWSSSSRPDLVGTGAIVLIHPDRTRCSAQFDEISTGMGWGWWALPTGAFYFGT